MSQDNATDKQFEQQKSESQVAALKNQAEGNFEADTEAAAESIAENLEDDDKTK